MSHEPHQQEASEGAPIRGSVTVHLELKRAFDLFTEGMGRWWPVEAYSRAVSEFEHEGIAVDELEFQARMGGWIVEHTTDGRALPWAEVIVWEPPQRAVMAWRPHSLPEPPTELDVRFKPVGGGTLLEIEHRGWERLSPDFRAGLYPVYARGWVTTLERFAAAAERGRRPQP